MRLLLSLSTLWKCDRTQPLSLPTSSTLPLQRSPYRHMSSSPLAPINDDFIRTPSEFGTLFSNPRINLASLSFTSIATNSTFPTSRVCLSSNQTEIPLEKPRGKRTKSSFLLSAFSLPFLYPSRHSQTHSNDNQTLCTLQLSSRLLLLSSR